MIKVTAENPWIAQDVHQKHSMSAVFASRWMGKIKRALQYFDQRGDQRGDQRVFNDTGSVASSKKMTNIWVDYLRLQQQKAVVVESDSKDEFFYGIGYANRKKIPPKTWKRYGAFLHYLQEEQKLKSKPVLEAGQPAIPASNENSTTQARISFNVTVIKHQPIWATALNDMTLIEDDLSSLRFMKIEKLENVIVEAA